MRRHVLVLATMLVAATAAAEEETGLVVCRTGKGEVKVVDVPPPGCVVEEKPRGVARGEQRPAVVAPPPRPGPPLVAAPPPPAPDGFLDLGEAIGDAERLRRFDAQANEERRTIERRAEENRRRVEKLRERVRSLLEASGEDLRSGAGGAETYADALQRRDATVTRLRAEELELGQQWLAIERDFELLSAKVQRAHGGTLPEEWLPKLVCERCP